MVTSIRIGARTREVIKADSPELEQVNLIAVGETTADESYAIERERFPCGHLIATIAGEGRCRIGDEWRPCLPGTVFINPPGHQESFQSAKGRSWTFCWLHIFPSFFESRGTPEQQLIEVDVTPLQHAVEGFLHTSYSHDYGETSSLWVDLIHFYASSYIAPNTRSRELDRVWAAVSRDPGHAWEISGLARLGRMSREQLRLKSKRETGRSPMQQVTHLRMRRAMELLQISDYKLDVVAELVGYDNAFSFSNAFLKATGRRPSDCRPKE